MRGSSLERLRSIDQTLVREVLEGLRRAAQLVLDARDIYNANK
jgi:hypothetical protein